MLRTTPVALEAAHIKWHSQEGPDTLANALCLCELHHALFDLGVLGLTEDRSITVSPLYVARSPAGRAVEEMQGRHLIAPRVATAVVDVEYIDWHTIQVFKRWHTAA